MRVHLGSGSCAAACLAGILAACANDADTPDRGASDGTGGVGFGTGGGTFGSGGSVSGSGGAAAGSGGSHATGGVSNGSTGGTGGNTNTGGAPISGTGGASDTGGVTGSGGSFADAGTTVPPAAGYLHTDGSKIVDASGQPVRITGINWFGMETSNYAPHGLWSRSMASFLDQIETLGYNALRVPFCSQLFDSGSTPSGIDFNQNPDLQGLTGLEILDKLVEGAGARGLRVILDRHRPDSGSQSELWYTSQFSEQRFIDDWTMLASHYLGNTTVVGFDLHNEPHGTATWGDGNQATDWKAAAERAGDAVLDVNPQLLIIVEGIEKFDGTSGWWGGNLRGAAQHPVQLKVAHRLVYSAHDYPASVFNQTWFSAPDYPDNLDQVWIDAWGYLVQNGTAPVWLGEFGTRYQTDVDQKWLNHLAGYIQTNQMNFAYWCLNPNSGDTGGILQDDWITVNQDKQSVLQPILAPLIP